MEYRMKYRDIPWRVAIGVLPGKIIGSFIIRPYVFLDSKRWVRHVIGTLKLMGLIAILAMIVIALVSIIVDALTGSHSSRDIAVSIGILKETIHPTLPIGPWSH